MTILKEGILIWITGLSCSGKTTLATSLIKTYQASYETTPFLLDGDEMRDALSYVAKGYKREDRFKLEVTYSKLCQLCVKQKKIVICNKKILK